MVFVTKMSLLAAKAGVSLTAKKHRCKAETWRCSRSLRSAKITSQLTYL